MHLYGHPDDELPPEHESEDSEEEALQRVHLLDSLNTDISFAEPVVTSTQKPRETQVVAETIEESQPFPDSQPPFGSPSRVRRDDITSSSANSDHNRSYSPHPK